MLVIFYFWHGNINLLFFCCKKWNKKRTFIRKKDLIFNSCVYLQYKPLLNYEENKNK